MSHFLIWATVGKQQALPLGHWNNSLGTCTQALALLVTHVPIPLEPSVAPHHLPTGPGPGPSTTRSLPSQRSAHAACVPWAISSEHRVLAAWKALPYPDQLANSQRSMDRRMHTIG